MKGPGGFVTSMRSAAQVSHTRRMNFRSGVLLLALALALGACDSPTPRSDGGVATDAAPRVDAFAPGADAAGSDAATPAVDAGASTDPLAAAREACVAEINRLRATRSLPAYGRWTAAEVCVDQQASADEASGDAHGAWSGGAFPECNGNAQNECLGGGAAGVVSCLGRMWAEREQAGCAGCDACADAYNPSCPDCDFFGSATGDVCGHYVNMSARYFTEVACGFSDGGGWAAQNFH
jgi:hypothetical protein